MSNITAVPYFYDKQLRKYIQQFIRLFAGFQFVISQTESGEPIYQTVPVRYGDMNRVAAHILKQNSENVVNTVPFISCYVMSLQIDPTKRTYAQFEDKVPVIEKKFDNETNTYSNEAGDTYTLQRYQPVPYKLMMNCDIWTSNTETKMQLLEQILVLFNPSVNIHTNNNALDWSNLSTVELTNVQWSNRTIPQGVDDIIDISTLTFEIPIFINPAAKVRRNTVIHTIVANIHDVATGDAASIESVTDIVPRFTSYKVITLENYKMRFTINSSGVATAVLLNSLGGNTNSSGDPLLWYDVLQAYGEFRDGVTQLRLKQTTDPMDTTDDIIGTCTMPDPNVNELVVTLDVDTIPANTQSPVNSIIDPEYSYPNDGTLPAAANGQRYLILNSIPEGGLWGSVSADKNDIIQYNGSVWTRTFDASATTGTHYTTNLTTLDKLKWTGTQWISAFEGTYNPGFWRIYL